LKQAPLLGFVGGLIFQEKRQFGGMNRKMFRGQMTNEPGKRKDDTEKKNKEPSTMRRMKLLMVSDYDGAPKECRIIEERIDCRVDETLS
jgi:hypothetical protein